MLLPARDARAEHLEVLMKGFGAELRSHLGVSQVHEFILKNSRCLPNFHSGVNIKGVADARNGMSYFLETLLKLNGEALVSRCIYISKIARQGF